MNQKVYSLLLAALSLGGSTPSWAQVTPVSQMERLDRGLIVVPADKGEFVSWRLLGTDDDDATTFDVLRNGVAIAQNLSSATSYTDKSGTSANSYQVVTRVNGVAVDTTRTVKPWGERYLNIKLDRPAGAAGYSYTPNDCSVGDVDGDGQYELFVKWDPTNSKDNSQSGKTGNVYIDCYKLDGTKLWRVDMGQNIRAGAHYTQFLVYDFDGDGRAEMICKTAPMGKDGQGHYITEAATDPEIRAMSNTVSYRDSKGRIMSGPELLTVFKGLTGAAVHTIYYNPNRAGGLNATASYPSSSSFWGDSYANRSERYLATVAYLGGPNEHPSAVMCRGYYTRAYLWAVDFDGKELKTRWLHASVSNSRVEHYDSALNKTVKTYTTNTCGKGSHHTAYGNGNHNLSCADVDGDGKDEVVWGQCAIDDDGQLLYSVGYGHGDALHLSDLNPDRPGLEMFAVHEENVAPYGWDIHDAATGEVLLSGTGKSDNGRGLAADLDAGNRGFEFCSSNDRSIRSAQTGEQISARSTSVNFRVYWDGDLQDELLDGGKIDKWNGNGTSRLYIGGKNLYDIHSSKSCNSTKSTPCLSADILGDWREEVILWSGTDSASLNVFSSTEPTSFRVPTLMHDHVYRLGVAWQNVAYNQPPHLGYYLPDRFATRFEPLAGAMEQTINLGDSIETIVMRVRNCNFISSKIDSLYLPDGTRLNKLNSDFSQVKDYGGKTITLKGKPSLAGDYVIVVKGVKNVVDGKDSYTRIRIHVVSATGIGSIETQAWRADDAVYDLRGVRQNTTLSSLPDGIYITNGKKVLR